MLPVYHRGYYTVLKVLIEGIIRFGRLCGSENAVFSVGFVAYFFFGKYKMIFDEMFFFVIFFLMIFF